MRELRVIFGDQLFPLKHLPKPAAGPVLMAEDPVFCTVSADGSGFRHHKQKIVLFLAAMRSYRDQLEAAGYRVIYSELDESMAKPMPFVDRVRAAAKQEGVDCISWFEISDRSAALSMEGLVDNSKLAVRVLPSLGFLTPRDLARDWLNGRKQLKLGDFYSWQRKRLGILLVGDSEPVGGKWSFDGDNRQALPADVFPPQPLEHRASKHVSAVKKLVAKHFAQHPGSLEGFAWPTTRKQALAQLNHFIDQRLATFGPYQDALTSRSDTVFHSLLTPVLNMGLITPAEVVAAALKRESEIPLASLEGFIRQIIGWREFLFAVDSNHGQAQSEGNHFKHQGKLSAAWYEGNTGLPALDAMIHKCQRTGYAHHIERLMVAGNVMLLAGIHPHEAYRWFMEMFIDSAEWIMGPNVYGMALFSDGGLFATKPYCCASSYWRKQAGKEAKLWDQAAGKHWGDGLDGMYWDFVERNSEEFSENHRMVRQVWALNRLKDERRKRIAKAGEELRSRLCL